jgi:ferredoxin
MSGIAIITEACIETKDRACVDVCPVQCIYEFDPVKNVLFSEVEAGNGMVENSHAPNPDAIAIFGDSILYVNTDECTSCTACYQPDVCPVGAIYSEEKVPDGVSRTSYNSTDTGKGHDHTFFVQLSRDVFAD